jgi:predicted membrane channel-forming protein YqfA (hemolysin III family)
MVAAAIGLIMAPAAYHREAERGTISRYLADYASRLIMIAMLPLLIAISIEVALVAYAILALLWVSALCGVALGLFFVSLWFVFPALRRRAAL